MKRSHTILPYGARVEIDKEIHIGVIKGKIYPCQDRVYVTEIQPPSYTLQMQTKSGASSPPD
jgi:hypothetical protein